MPPSTPPGLAADEQPGGWVLCEQAGRGAPGATIAHLVNRAAQQNPGRDIAVALGGVAAPPGWERVLRVTAERESTTATVSALSLAAVGVADIAGGSSIDGGRDQTALSGGLGADERAVLEQAVGGSQVVLVPDAAAVGPAHARALAPRAGLVTGPLVYLVRAALDLLGGMDETLATSAAAVAELGLRARELGLANLAAPELVAAPGRSVLLSDDDRAELARRFPALWVATGDPPSGAVERALRHAKVAVERKLTVTVDARTLGTATGGTQIYTLELLRALDATGEVQVRALVAGEPPPELGGLSNTKTVTYREALDGVPASDLVHRPQQVFSVDDLTLLQPLGHRLAVTQLDLIAYHSPTYFPDRAAWRRHVRATRIAMDAADRVLFLSDHGRADAEREDLIDRERTAVVPLGVSPCDAPAQQASSRPPGLVGRDEPFLLCLGSDYAHKNRPHALRLTAALRRNGWTGGLVLAGAHVEHGSSEAAERAVLARDDDLAGAVLDVGAVSEPERRWLMSHARAVVYPTVLEGFGLVPLEAAAAGVPCLFAAQSSLAEILPAQLATLDGWNVERSALLALPLLRDGDERAGHLSRMREVLRAYTWERCARLTIEAYRATLASRARLSARAAWEAHARELEIVGLDRAARHNSAELQKLLDSLGEDGLALVGPRGLLSVADRRALLALAARGPLRRPMFAGLRGAYRVLHRRPE